MLGLRKIFRRKPKTTTHTMKVALAKMTEIDDFWTALNEIQDELRKSCVVDDPEVFELLIDRLMSCNHGKILFNLTTLMENVAKLDSDILEYNDKITKAIELLDYKEMTIFQKIKSKFKHGENK